MDGLRISAGAISAAQTSLNVTANNLANVNTTGFKATLSNLETGPGGRGVEVGAITKTQNPGPVEFTGRSLDLAATGNSYFSVRRSDGRLAFTKDGSFQIDGQGRVATSSGDLLDPPITVPNGAQSVGVGRDGSVAASFADGRRENIGRVQPVRFANPAGLENIGGNLVQPSANSGEGQRVDGAEILQGGLELSNVDIASEMVNLIKQEKFSAFNVVAFKTQDEVAGTLLDLKR